jgi:hypothetical protein
MGEAVLGLSLHAPFLAGGCAQPLVPAAFLGFGKRGWCRSAGQEM